MTLLNWTILLGIGSYLWGGIPCGLLLGRLKGIDVRKAGSGNIGAANVGRLLGRSWGIAVFVLDAAKGTLATVLAGQVLIGFSGSAAPQAQEALGWLAVGMCAVLGHNYSPYLGFRGGKGVATSMGVALGVYPDLTYPALLAFGVWLAGVALTRMSSVGSISAAIAFPMVYATICMAKFGSLAGRWPFLVFSLLTCVLVVVRHRANISRIIAGKEARLVGGANQKGKVPLPTDTLSP